jgi:pimeloyl-ACP methyl ester carboxylesterase
MLTPLLSVVTAAAAPALNVAGCALQDAGRPDDGRGPVALLVESPGVRHRAHLALVDRLELGGLDVWTLRIPVSAQRPDELVSTAIPAALAALPGRPRLLVGHGAGGTLAAQAVLALPAPDRPDGLALLGAPLSLPPSELSVWLAGQGPRHAALDLGPLADAAPSWGDQPVVALLWGAPDAPLGRLSGAMAETYRAWATGGLDLDLRALAALPVWAAAGSEDRLAPVESVRPALSPEHTFHRYGRAALMPHPYTHSDLLDRARPARDLAAWATQTLDGGAP